MEPIVLVAVAVVVLVVVALARAGGDPSRTLSGMWRYGAPEWPSGVQEDDDAHWSWADPAIAPPGAAQDAEETGDDGAGDPGDEGLTVDVAPIGYEVRSPDRDRS